MRLLIAFGLFAYSLVALASGLVGIWRGTLDGEALVIELKADGTGTLDGDPIRYQQMGQMLMVELDGETMAYAIQQNGDRMIVSGGDLDAAVTLDRGARSKAAAAPASRSAAAAGKGGIDASMAGRWCHVASFNAVSGGGSQSSRCFELGSDGRYRYQSDSSMSAYAPGAWGGTNGSSTDAGRWSVAGGVITATSDSGAVSRYPLEKRNHPKTRDPMLCLDGDCYVTQFQKPSW
ncbi:hypothetical protein DFR24_0794 [Panacagrimonas perspica]|uniref:Uncharacterized protein n=1 Tax=Panacagrimonas perspica TaxID=381431 RepID=A0A4V3F654_9GAMM|nr:hypothetical protein [Panacagrimonas perspica]TDU31426.1 hypothetical protein DFR24_0794 [Panacagrimonas perspica]THD00831.1 hypothetical protein B1810_23235 [Panacagrimonas perspica]